MLLSALETPQFLQYFSFLFLSFAFPFGKCKLNILCVELSISGPGHCAIRQISRGARITAQPGRPLGVLISLTVDALPGPLPLSLSLQILIYIPWSLITNVVGCLFAVLVGKTFHKISFVALRLPLFRGKRTLLTRLSLIVERWLNGFYCYCYGLPFRLF